MNQIKYKETLRHLRKIARDYNMTLRQVDTVNGQALFALYERLGEDELSERHSLNWWRLSQKDKVIQKVGSKL